MKRHEWPGEQAGERHHGAAGSIRMDDVRPPLSLDRAEGLSGTQNHANTASSRRHRDVNHSDLTDVLGWARGGDLYQPAASLKPTCLLADRCTQTAMQVVGDDKEAQLPWDEHTSVADAKPRCRIGRYTILATASVMALTGGAGRLDYGLAGIPALVRTLVFSASLR
jgi:hypothetical protein